ncbi:MAG: biliverdin-producing heme oxygenase [Actinobacteria bacterium]|nr:biliverdin-producing heme oxygenase [Actinomycetota bacterium]MCB8996707.1 biliverdin-producing heme oxygenase [Actinomycetota bacterium]MCB9415104.1 biliverdin-producing heme oxygenase [Actinomycetota bacterium]
MLTTDTFASRLRAATIAHHSAAETSGFMSGLLDGTLASTDYAHLVSQLQLVYAALDHVSSQHRDDPTYGPFFDPRLDRTRALAADTATLGAAPVATATRTYADRIDAVAADPLLVLAHHYTRYMGDLSGGQAISAVLARTMGLSAHEGLAFYQFDLGPLPRYKNAYRERLDDLHLTDDDERRFIGEVLTAYTLNSAVFTELDQRS